MAKRTATSQLTADNWQEEDNDEAEEAGSFARASEAEMRARLIKKAKRTTGNMSTGGLFSGVKLTGSVNGGPPPVATTKPNTEDDYLHQLECLNNSVSDWIAQHVRHNPLVDLTPIFRDYEMYLAALDKNRNNTTAAITTTTLTMKQVSPAMTESFVTANTMTGLVATSNVVATSNTETVQSDSCNINVTTTTVATTTSGERSSQGASDEDDVPIVAPPKPPADQPIKDEDSLLALRCKLFYKKDDSYVELGLGVLRVKEDQNKGVLLMRNDTHLGNILLNISLSPQLPVSRAGKNNVLLMCPPNPPLKIKPTNQNEQEQSSEGGVVTYLIRVKTTTLADQLYNLVKQLQTKLT